MVFVRISRQSGEVVADAGSPAALSRLDLEIAGKANEAVTAVKARVSRQSAEVVSQTKGQVATTRLDLEIAGKANEAVTAVALQISRQSAEVVASATPVATVTRFDLEIAGKANEAVTAVTARISRQTAESIARRGSAGPIVPLALSGDDDEVFMHDWVDEVVLVSSYLTDVTVSPNTGAESRRGLALKPSRSMDLVWVQTKEEFDEFDFSRLDRLIVFLRRITDRRFQVPLYPDQRDLSQAYLSTASVISLDTTRGRWFEGARVVVVQHDLAGHYASHSFHLISNLQDDSITLTADLGVAVKAGSVILPVIDCEVVLDVTRTLQTGCLAEVRLTVDEVAGASQLPPTKADTPVGVPTHRGIPILNVDPDWTDGVQGGRSRAGIEFSSGRSRSVSKYAARSREKQVLRFTNERPGYWRLVETFDTRRGRLRSFWQLDPEQIWTIAQVDPTFVSIEQFGDLADVQEELQSTGQIGLVTKTGDYFVRDVSTVQQVATVFKFTINPNLPASLLTTDVIRVTRARLVRFTKDEMEERWTNAGLAETELEMIETLEEKVVDL